MDLRERERESERESGKLGLNLQAEELLVKRPKSSHMRVFVREDAPITMQQNLFRSPAGLPDGSSQIESSHLPPSRCSTEYRPDNVTCNVIYITDTHI